MNLDTLLQEFKKCSLLQYNGQLNIQGIQGNKWTFYYQLGQIVWATGGVHPRRRWLRNMNLICPEIDIDKIELRDENILIEYWDYLLLENLYHTGQIQQKQFNDFVTNTIGEILFDLAQQVNVADFSCEINQDTILKALMISTSTNMFIKAMQDAWHNWSQAGLRRISPHLSPVIRQPEKLRQQVSNSFYKNFERLINGQHTLLDLAAKMRQSVLAVTHSLRLFIEKGIVELIEVPDLPSSIIKIQQSLNYKQLNQENSPLIACIDDSLLACKILESIIVSNGMRFLGIQDPLQAIPILIQHQPNLIFLDLIMPVSSGYQICEQLRRCSYFANTPIIILTGSEGVFDRFRARVFGANDFINKPVYNDNVVQIMHQYLQTKSSEINIPELVLYD
ncbi:response regulator [Anabaena catenula]|uniref:Protein PatA n=1 Tax=Anabaena catenula FACHB-362 TaxID=2692877 RepID=A0ABR8J574_9NOST|nr:response regulator [Anabaena catenula]MBD2693504.1 response regulator [Anabaena catenula FACHB-362]